MRASKSTRTVRTRDFSFRDPLVKLFVAAFLIAGIVFMGVFAYFYVKYERVVDRRMAGGIFSNAAKIYARPHTISVGEKMDQAELAVELRRAGYSEDGDSAIGHYHLGPDGLHVMPGPQSFHGADSAAVIRFDRGKVSSISAAGGNHQEIAAYELEPQLVTALFEGQDRSKRELIKFQDIPPVLVNAVLAIEDRRFFQHGGVNYFRLIEAAAVDRARRPPRAGRLDHHHAALARVLPHSRRRR